MNDLSLTHLAPQQYQREIIPRSTKRRLPLCGVWNIFALYLWPSFLPHYISSAFEIYISSFVRNTGNVCSPPSFTGLTTSNSERQKKMPMLIFLSRLPLQNKARDNSIMEALFYNEIIDALPISPSDISNVSRMDSVISNNCIHHTLRGWPENLSDKVKPYVQRKMELSVQKAAYCWAQELLFQKNFGFESNNN